MPNPYGAPEISVQEVAEMRRQSTPFLLLDVRELNELSQASLGDGVDIMPLSDLAQRQLQALPAGAADKTTPIVVFCHHGVRSAQVTAWLLDKGWSNVRSMAGGIEAYALEVDPSVGRY